MSIVRECLAASVKAHQAEELCQGWLGSSWIWGHSNATFSSLGHSRGVDNLWVIKAVIVAVDTVVRRACGL